MAILQASKLLIVILILIKISYGYGEEDARSESTTSRLLRKRNHDKDYPPRFSHQPASVQVAPRRPHTIECPVDSQPESEVKWFKDQQALESQPGHFEQAGSELMFVQTLDEDTGDYSCQASNYLGTVTSAPFKLTVQSNENISLTPPTYLASERQDQPVEFTCTLPKTLFNQRNNNNLPITWRRNGRPLQVEWSTRTASKNRFRAYQLQGDQSNIVILNIYQVTREHDDNSTFSCALAGGHEDELAHESRGALLRVNEPKPAAEDPVKLDIPMGKPALDANSGESAVDLMANRTTDVDSQRPQSPRVKTSLSETLADLYLIAKPTLMIFGSLCLVSVIVLLQFLFIRRRAQRLSHRYLKHGGHRHHHHHSCSGSSSVGGGVNGGCNSSGSATSSGASSALGCGEDPVLSSLLARTLSAPSASSLGANASKKYKYYRGKVAAAISPTPPASLFLTRPQREELEKEFRMNPYPSSRVCTAIAQCLAMPDRQVKDWFAVRRVWAKAESDGNANNNNQLVAGDDLLDAPNYFMACENQILPGSAQLLDDQNQILMYANQGEPAIPNLYNQSVAAREQARSLLGVCERMRSMDNLPTSGQLARQEHPLARQHNVIMSSATGRFNNGNRAQQQPQHVLTDLTMNFNSPQDSATSHNYPFALNKGQAGPLESGAASLIQQQQSMWNQQQCQQQASEQYQLVSCSSVSPSSSSSVVATSQASPHDTQDTTSLFAEKPPPPPRAVGTQVASQQQQPRESVTSNHYSIIGANDSGPDDGEQDEETRYEELDDRQAPVANFRRHQQQSSAQLRASIISSRSGHSNSTVSNSQASESYHTSTTSSRFGSKRSSGQSRGRAPATTNQQHDQLSPYAVSSICHQPQQQQQPPPPMTSEAMRALNEQFDINQLMMMDGGNKQDSSTTDQQQRDTTSAGDQEPPKLPFSLPPPPLNGNDESPPRASERIRHYR